MVPFVRSSVRPASSLMPSAPLSWESLPRAVHDMTEDLDLPLFLLFLLFLLCLLSLLFLRFLLFLLSLSFSLFSAQPQPTRPKTDPDPELCMCILL